MLLLACFAAVTARAQCDGCRQYSPNKIDYNDTTIITVQNTPTAQDCCNACKSHNAGLGPNPAAANNCTVGVWHGPAHKTCTVSQVPLI
jgi:hypothetical protein